MNSPPAPAAATPLQLAVVSPDDHQTQLQIVPSANAPVGVLWLPALGVPARKYLAYANRLNAHGIVVALHEWRGHGASNRRASWRGDWGYSELLADVAAARQALAAEYPQVRWVIGGHSLGAQLAALSLALEPERYAGYVIVGSGQPWWRRFPGWHAPGILAVFALFRTLCLLFGYFPGDRVGFGGREARGVIRDWVRSGRSGNYVPDRVPTDLEQALRRLSHPVMAVHLSSDTYVPAASLQHLLQKLSGAKLHRVELDDAQFSGGRAGHFDWMRDSGPVVQRIVEWSREFVQSADAPASLRNTTQAVHR